MLRFLKHIAVVIGFLMPLCAWSSNEPSVLTVEMKSGTTYDFYLSEQPVITFDANHLYISTNDFSAEYDDVERIYFANNSATEVEETVADDIKPHVSITFTDGRHVSIKGCEENARVMVFAINGTKVNVYTSQSYDGVDLDFSSQPVGIYIIRVNSQSFKIRTR